MEKATPAIHGIYKPLSRACKVDGIVNVGCPSQGGGYHVSPLQYITAAAPSTPVRVSGGWFRRRGKPFVSHTCFNQPSCEKTLQDLHLLLELSAVSLRPSWELPTIQSSGSSQNPQEEGQRMVAG